MKINLRSCVRTLVMEEIGEGEGSEAKLQSLKGWEGSNQKSLVYWFQNYHLWLLAHSKTQNKLWRTDHRLEDVKSC